MNDSFPKFINQFCKLIFDHKIISFESEVIRIKKQFHFTEKFEVCTMDAKIAFQVLKENLEISGSYKWEFTNQKKKKINL